MVARIYIPKEINSKYIHKKEHWLQQDKDDLNPKKRSSGSQFYIIVQGQKLKEIHATL